MSRSMSVGRTTRRPKRNYSFFRISFRIGTLTRGQYTAQQIALLGKEHKEEIMWEAWEECRIPKEIHDVIEETRVPHYDKEDRRTWHWKYCILPRGVQRVIAYAESIPIDERPWALEIRTPLGDLVYRCSRVKSWCSHQKTYVQKRNELLAEDTNLAPRELVISEAAKEAAQIRMLTKFRVKQI